jgi:hypothetical protein
MVEDGKRDVSELRAQARRARSLASGLLPGEDRRRLSELAVSLEQEAAAATDGASRDAQRDDMQRQAAE